MRLDRGTNGDLRQSALWGKASKGETRSSALWGKGGRGFVSLVVVALALTASTAAIASSRYATTPGLVASAKANPAQTFNVIIQGDADKTTGAIASDVKNELKSGEPGRAKGIKRQFTSVNGVAANLTGAQILHLVSKNGIAAITTDSQNPARRQPLEQAALALRLRRPEVLGQRDLGRDADDRRRRLGHRRLAPRLR